MAFKESLFSICPERSVEAVDTAAGRTYVRTLTVAEKDAMDRTADATGRISRANMLIFGCCKEDGSPEFDEFDEARIGELPISHVEPIVDAFLKVNSLRVQDVEDVRKNSENGRTASSVSG